jgi:divalent metal cation (Fe/Co/Zn/Cd) transporter
MEPKDREHLLDRANLLALFTIGYNFVEGIVSMALGASGETLALFGFGVDSFIEVMSAVGVWHMIRRIRNNGGESRDAFEQRALKITGLGFYLLTIGLLLTASVNLVQRHKPETTLWGIVVSVVSISFMWLLIHHKMKVGTALNSPAILADAACSKACLYLSLVLLLASLGFQLTGIGSLDAIGALVIALLTGKEGRESYSKAKGMNCHCEGKCSDTSS